MLSEDIKKAIIAEGDFVVSKWFDSINHRTCVHGGVAYISVRPSELAELIRMMAESLKRIETL